MHIGVDAHLFSRGHSYRAAGISRHIGNLLEHLGRLEGDDRFTAFVGPGNVGEASDGRIRYRQTRLPTERPAARVLWEQVVAPIEIAAGRLDVFHGPAYALPLLATCPTVLTVHDLSFERMPELFNRVNRVYLRLFNRLAVARARYVIAVSEFTRRELIALLRVPADRITVIPNGVEPAFRPLPHEEVERFREARGLPERFILCLATLEPRKNVATLVRAFARLRRGGRSGHKLVLAGGKGWLYDAIFAEVRALGIEDEVLFPGYVPFAEQPLWYNAAAAFAFPSLYEGFGIPPLEAMACGTPVVCSNGTSLPEVVGDAGLTVGPMDEVALSDAMARLIDDEALRCRLREAGLARARLFDWADVARRTQAVYRQAVA